MALIRLNKILQDLGVASRRRADALIADGAIAIDGKVVTTLGAKFDPDAVKITVNGQTLSGRSNQKKYYLLLNKPVGYVCSNARTRGEKLALDLLHSLAKKARLFTVGRLDKDTRGLLLITNDGDFAHKIMHPSFGMEKEYFAKVDRKLIPRDIALIKKGIFIDGKKITPLDVVQTRPNCVKITVSDGKKHEVRKLIAETRAIIYELKRIRIGSLKLGNLPEGSFRDLTAKEIRDLSSHGRVLDHV